MAVVLESVMHRLHELIVLLWRSDIRLRVMRVRGDTVGAFMRQNVSRHAAPYPTFSRLTGDVRDTRDSSAILAEWRVGRQGERASATFKKKNVGWKM
jgi:hypothetical protein